VETSKWLLLQSKITAVIQVGLVTTAITMTNNVRVRVWGVTCDGNSTNLSTMTHLGCKLHGSYDELVEYFYIPGIDRNVKTIYNKNQHCIIYLFLILYLFIIGIPDACHNIKLARNALGTYQKFKSVDGIIDWTFIQNLNKGILKD